MKVLITLAAVTAAIATQASAASSTDTCFRRSEMGNHAVGDPSTLYLKVGFRDVYRLTMSGACLAGALPSDPLIITSPPTSALICQPIDLRLSVGKGGFATPCIVKSMTKLTPAEISALPPKSRP